MAEDKDQDQPSQQQVRSNLWIHDKLNFGLD